MTREEFIGILEEEGYSYGIEGNKIVVTYRDNVHLDSLQTLPPDVEFRSGWDVYLNSLKTLPPGVEFKNGGSVYLASLETIPPGVKFKDTGMIYLGSLSGGWFKLWNGNIKGIKPSELLNKMIEDGLFDRR